MYDVLLVDTDLMHIDSVIRQLAPRNLRIRIIENPAQAAGALRSSTAPYRLVILNVSDPQHPWLRTLEDLQSAVRADGRFSSPKFLCVSTRQYEPRFELQIEGRGARYVFER